jgi:iron transport multicopper oxidase
MPGKKFTYQYNTSAESPGTYWIHNHMAGQYPKGLRAPLIILDKDRSKEASNWKNKDGNEIWDPRMDYILSLSDW